MISRRKILKGGAAAAESAGYRSSVRGVHLHKPLRRLIILFPRQVTITIQGPWLVPGRSRHSTRRGPPIQESASASSEMWLAFRRRFNMELWAG